MLFLGIKMPQTKQPHLKLPICGMTNQHIHPNKCGVDLIKKGYDLNRIPQKAVFTKGY
jgi:hypothetical protein